LILNRIKKIESTLETNKNLCLNIINFEEWSGKLDQYFIAWHNGWTDKNNLYTYEDEENLLKEWLSKDLMTQKEYDLIIDSAKEIWRQTKAFMSIPANEGGCIVFINTEKKLWCE